MCPICNSRIAPDLHQLFIGGKSSARADPFSLWSKETRPEIPYSRLGSTWKPLIFNALPTDTHSMVSLPGIFVSGRRIAARLALARARDLNLQNPDIGIP